MTTTREKRSLDAKAPRSLVLVSTDTLVVVIPSAARDLQFLCSGALSHDAALSHSRGTACRARSRHTLKCAIELHFATALSASVILPALRNERSAARLLRPGCSCGTKDLSCQ